jgi:Putative DNA-binding domain
MSAPTLAETQRLLWTLLTAPEGAAAGFARLAPRERVLAESLAQGDARLSAVERLDIYADMYFYRIRDSLREQFPALHAVLGATHFHNLLTDYLLAHPPAHFSLRYTGADLPAYLGGHALGDERPYLADLAALEWAILAAFDAPDGPVLTAPALTQVPPDRWPALRFDLVPALRRLELRWPVDEIWQHTQRGEALSAPPAPQALHVRVWRQNLRVFHRRIDVGEAAALEALAGGATFAEVCTRIAEHYGEAGAPEAALALIHTWLQDEVLASCTLP